jgi:hypothetical protein
MPAGVVDDTYYYENPAMPLVSGDYGSGVILPSSEAHFYDFAQAHAHNYGSGINVAFPNPFSSNSADQFSEDWWNVSGLLRTYPEEAVVKDEKFWRGHPVLSAGDRGGGHSGVFYYVGLRGQFSNLGTVVPISDFNIFNQYIHHARDVNGSVTFIPYVSDYIVSVAYNPYVPIIRY